MSPFQFGFDRFLAEDPLLARAIATYEDSFEGGHIIVIQVAQGGLPVVSENLSKLAQICQSLGRFEAIVITWRDVRKRFSLEDLALLEPSAAETLEGVFDQALRQETCRDASMRLDIDPL